ncbi:MAG: hypothetical protein QXE76_01200 [Candidatus Bathyarchaeia archaeon]
MSQEPTMQKLMIDKPSDFRFHAAYLVYSDAWDKATTNEAKAKLNEIITALSKNEIEYQDFYREISRYRVEFNPEHFNGQREGRIVTKSKRDWRKEEARQARNARYRK